MEYAPRVFLHRFRRPLDFGRTRMVRCQTNNNRPRFAEEGVDQVNLPLPQSRFKKQYRDNYDVIFKKSVRSVLESGHKVRLADGIILEMINGEIVDSVTSNVWLGNIDGWEIM